MRKAANSALKTKYVSKKWKMWFVETAKRITKELDAESTDDTSHDVDKLQQLDLQTKEKKHKR